LRGATLPVSGVRKALLGVVVAFGELGGMLGGGGTLGATGMLGAVVGGGTDEVRIGSAGGIERNEAGPSRYRSLS
jgi:hypothetical protein